MSNIPYLIYYYEPNPEYGKTYTLDDIEKPSEESFGYVLGDYMTLGKPIPTYEDWAARVQQCVLEAKLLSSKCQRRICKLAIENAANLEKNLEAMKDEDVAFMDPKIQARYMEIKNRV